MSRGAFGRPDKRPVPQLHRGYAFAIVRRSQRISPAAKLVYGRMLELDRTSAGVFSSPEHLAADLGLGLDTVRKLRKELADLGLLYLYRVKTATMVREFWYCTLPFTIDTVPALARDIPLWIADWAGILDSELAAKCAGDSGQISRQPRPNPPPTQQPTPNGKKPSRVLDSQSETEKLVCELQSENCLPNNGNNRLRDFPATPLETENGNGVSRHGEPKETVAELLDPLVEKVAVPNHDREADARAKWQ